MGPFPVAGPLWRIGQDRRRWSLQPEDTEEEAIGFSVMRLSEFGGAGKKLLKEEERVAKVVSLVSDIWQRSPAILPMMVMTHGPLAMDWVTAVVGLSTWSLGPTSWPVTAQPFDRQAQWS